MFDPFGAFVGHLIGDYLLQPDWMAKEKKISTPICLSHCMVWATCVELLSTEALNSHLFFMVLTLTHFLQDRWDFVPRYMGWMGQAGFRDGPHSPWSAVVVDNVFHLLVIFLLSKVF